MNLLKKLKEYDDYLTFEKKLDGSVVIYRKSPFFRANKYKVFTIENKYIGSAGWIIKRICLMDNQRTDIVSFIKKKNLDIRNKKDDRRIHEDLADFVLNDTQVLIN